MSAMAKVGRLSSRYMWAKVQAASDAVLNAMNDPAKQAARGSLMQVFSEAYNQQLTKIIGITGAAMAPALNPVSVCCICSSNNCLMAHNARLFGTRVHYQAIANRYGA